MRILALAIALGIAAAAVAGKAAPPPTFRGQVDRILRKHCDECHHAGDVGPMALDDYATAKEWAPGIVGEIESGRMPPWRPSRGVGRFLGERSVSGKELDVLRRWRDAGAPEGRGPVRPRVASAGGWTLGTPNATLDYGEAIALTPEQDDVYVCLPVKNPFGRDVWLSAIDVKPGDRRVLHHVVLYLDSAGESETLDANEPGPGYTCFGGPGVSQTGVLGGWAPGNRARFLPRGSAMRLRANDTVVIQCHYHAHSITEPTTDHTVIGLYESKDAAPTEVFLLPILNDTFTIPAGDPAYPVETTFDPASLTGGLIQVSGRVLAVLPHMHLLGRTIEVDLLLPDATEQRLVEIDDWDFNWQDTYTFAKPVPVPARTKIRLRSTYDNSAANERNPNVPPQPVSYGERTTDEMCLAFLAVSFGPATADAPPVVRKAVVDPSGRLTVTAKGLGRGGRIEIEGTPVADSAAAGANRLRSVAGWLAAAPASGPIIVRVRRTDGRLSQPFSFIR